MKADAAEIPPDPATNLEEPEAQRIELHPADTEPHEPAAQGGQEPVDGDMQEQPEGVGEEGVIAQPIDEAALLEILDPEFGTTAPLDIPVVENVGRIVPSRDDEAG